MSKRGSMLSVVALIVALAAVGIGAFSIIAANMYVLPKARVYYDGPTYAITDGGGPKLLNYNQKSYDTHGAFDLTSDSYSIPETGIYHVIAQYSIYAFDGDFFVIRIWSNNILVCSRSYSSSVTTNHFGVALSDNINFAKGDSITVTAYKAGPGGSRDIYDGEQYTFFAIAKIA